MQVFAVFSVADPARVEAGIAQTLGRAMERLDNQSHKIEQLDRTVQGLSEKVERISRDFAYIKKAWWVVLILIGIALKEAYDMVIRPMID